LTGDSNVFKLIGPVLVKQERSEAETNVKKRIEYIKSELTRLESQIKDLESKSDKKKMDIVKLQTAIQESRKGSQ
jgi:prefoldin beta subunit